MAILAASRPTSPFEGLSPPSPQKQGTHRPESPPPASQDEPSDATAPSRKPEQPSATELAKHGIKVRDFAYESTLPPINPVYFLPKQIQPDPGMLRPVQGHVPPSSSTSGEMHPIEKQPADLSIQLPSVFRQRGFFDLRDYDPDNDDLPDSQSSSCMLSQPPPSYSQESDEYVKTPIVTPNGSLQWQDVDNDSPFQLDGCPPFRPLSFSQARTPTQGEPGNKDTTSSMTSSPLSSTHSSFCISPSPVSNTLPGRRLRRRPSHTARARQSHLGKDPPPTVATSPASRYYLRKRRNSATSSSTSKPATRSRLGLAAVSPLPKPSQSATPSLPSARRHEGASNPPSTQTFRKRSTSSPTMKRSRKRS